MSERALREAVIDLDAITHNVATIRATVGTPHLMTVVKADGYGHGAVPVARAALAGGADWLGVVDAAEALPLREAGVTAPILTWLHAPQETFAAHEAAGLDVGVNSRDELERAAAAGVRNVQVKVDTGLGRNGAEESTWGALFERARQLEGEGGPRIRGLFSHLANAGPEADAAQQAAFERARAVAASSGIEPELLHLAATEGALGRPQARYNLVRVGLGSYGLSPFAGVAAAELGLVPALELSAAVVSVKRVPAGSGVSYGHRYHTERETTLALVPLGYSDGIPRQASNRGPVLIGGETYRVCGTVAMDQFVVDVGDAAVSVGDRAVVFGDPADGAPSAADWADAAGTINYELVARLGHRVARRYLGGG
ncbi:MAG TPA: alanine racemase [Terrimesophilobacter sp.]|nr:alanine racemase [Terrimesophilobacter sp.]